MIERLVDGRTDLVFDLVTQGHAPDSTDEHGVSWLQWCAYYGDVSATKFLVSRGASLTLLGDNFDLNGAAFHGHWRLCQYLIEQGADVNYPLPDTGETPLHAAASKANRLTYTTVAEVLLAAGADPKAATKVGVETGSFMRDCRTRGETPLHRAAAFGDERLIRMLIEAGGKRDAVDAHGDSPLSWASWHLRPAHILALLCHGPHRIHPDAVARSASDFGQYGSQAMEANLLGRPHLPKPD